MYRRTAFVFAVVGLLLAACRPVPREDHLTVFAAASLSEPFSALADSMKVRHPGLKIDFNFAGSQILALQLTQGASADVFASADQNWMRVVADSGLLAGPPLVFANNHLVVIVPASNPARIERPQDLARPKIKLVLAGEAVPVGRYARTVLAKLAKARGFSPEYQNRVLANLVSNEESVKGVVTKVQLGEADAGIVYSSDVTAKLSSRVLRVEIPEEENVTAVYPIAQLGHSANPALAREFLDLVLGSVGQRVLIASGFLSPPI